MMAIKTYTGIMFDLLDTDMELIRITNADEGVSSVEKIIFFEEFAS